MKLYYGNKYRFLSLILLTEIKTTIVSCAKSIQKARKLRFSTYFTNQIDITKVIKSTRFNDWLIDLNSILTHLGLFYSFK